MSEARGVLVSPAIRIEASNGLGTGVCEWEIPVPGDFYSEVLVDPSSDPYEIMDATGKTIAYIDELRITLDAEPYVELWFAVKASTVDTNFTISSALVTFDTIANPYAYATAAVTVTDSAVGGGATATGLFPDEKLYCAMYNDPAVPFAYLVDTVVAPEDSSNTGHERRPLSDWEQMGTPVYSIQSQFKFALTADDLASGTSTFEVVPGEIIPEPAAMVVVLMGVLGVVAQMRKK